MKKYKAKVRIKDYGNIYFYYKIVISKNATIMNEFVYGTKSLAKRAAERVAKKLGIGLIWTK